MTPSPSSDFSLLPFIPTKHFYMELLLACQCSWPQHSLRTAHLISQWSSFRWAITSPSALQWKRFPCCNETQAGAEGPPFCRTWEGTDTLPSKTGGACAVEQALCASPWLPPAEVLRTQGQEWVPTCQLHPEHHKAAPSQGSGCTHPLLMVSPEVHSLPLSLKLYVWEESFMGTP